jgi:hypothetical protein
MGDGFSGKIRVVRLCRTALQNTVPKNMVREFSLSDKREPQKITPSKASSAPPALASLAAFFDNSWPV